MNSTRNLVADPDTMYFYVPLFANSSYIWQTPLNNVFSSFLAFELFTIFIGTVINGAMIVALYNSSLIHPNLKAIWIAHLVEYFFFAIAQTALVCYQVGLLDATGEFGVGKSRHAKAYYRIRTHGIKKVLNKI